MIDLNWKFRGVAPAHIDLRMAHKSHDGKMAFPGSDGLDTSLHDPMKWAVETVLASYFYGVVSRREILACDPVDLVDDALEFLNAAFDDEDLERPNRELTIRAVRMRLQEIAEDYEEEEEEEEEENDRSANLAPKLGAALSTTAETLASKEPRVTRFVRVIFSGHLGGTTGMHAGSIAKRLSTDEKINVIRKFDDPVFPHWGLSFRTEATDEAIVAAFRAIRRDPIVSEEIE